MPVGKRVHRGAFTPLALSSNAVRRQPRGSSRVYFSVSARCTGMSANLTNQVTCRLKVPVSTWHRQAALALISASEQQ
eukprot:363889-Chlamydomonas_euryale.AAC.2